MQKITKYMFIEYFTVVDVIKNSETSDFADKEYIYIYIVIVGSN